MFLGMKSFDDCIISLDETTLSAVDEARESGKVILAFVQVPEVVEFYKTQKGWELDLYRDWGISPCKEIYLYKVPYNADFEKLKEKKIAQFREHWEIPAPWYHGEGMNRKFLETIRVREEMGFVEE